MTSSGGAVMVGRKGRVTGIFDDAVYCDAAPGIFDDAALGIVGDASIGMSYEMIFRGGFAGSVYNFACSISIAFVYQESSTFK